MTKHGARLHERVYCSVVREEEQKKRQESCEHKHMEMSYCTMPGEDHLQIPDYECCIDCGMSEWRLQNKRISFKGGRSYRTIYEDPELIKSKYKHIL
ncbi:hypothetical protein MOE65_20910 [Bacillus inaquosorum]|uniref:hypothetical protein n=1 Tax=Bacillus inaquosorum TaxID=483913 RepID=UPI00227E6B6A|nr:hypothetical protein [Bacillus inaquosorum]MCY9072831.1 hypothetical protein [Bacillus inaquosorum]